MNEWAVFLHFVFIGFHISHSFIFKPVIRSVWDYCRMWKLWMKLNTYTPNLTILNLLSFTNSWMRGRVSLLNRHPSQDISHVWNFNQISTPCTTKEKCSSNIFYITLHLKCDTKQKEISLVQANNTVLSETRLCCYTFFYSIHHISPFFNSIWIRYKNPLKLVNEFALSRGCIIQNLMKCAFYCTKLLHYCCRDTACLAYFQGSYSNIVQS